MSEKIYFYPIWTRLWHGLNAIFCLLLIASGISMQYANIDYPLIQFESAVSLHNFAGIALTLSYLIFFIGNIITSNGKHYRIRLKGLGKPETDNFCGINSRSFRSLTTGTDRIDVSSKLGVFRNTKCHQESK